jgi:hypothetical protein
MPDAVLEFAAEAHSCFAVLFNQKEQRYVFNGKKADSAKESTAGLRGIFARCDFPLLVPSTKGEVHADGETVERTGPSGPGAISNWLDNVNIFHIVEPSGNEGAFTSVVSHESERTTFEALLDPHPDINSNNPSPNDNLKSSVTSPDPIPLSLTFESLLQDDGAVSNTPHTGPTAGALTVCAKQGRRQDGMSELDLHRTESGFSRASEMDTENLLPSYGKQFATVDRIGLTADPASTARWELVNVRSLGRKIATTCSSTLRIQPQQRAIGKTDGTPGRGDSALEHSRSSKATMKVQTSLNFNDLMSFDAAEEPATTVQQFPDNFAAARTTMNQRAKNKGRGAKGDRGKRKTGTEKTVVRLPLPDPLPARKKFADPANKASETNKAQNASPEGQQRGHDVTFISMSEARSLQSGLRDFVDTLQQCVQRKSGMLPVNDADDEDDANDDLAHTGTRAKATIEVGTLAMLPLDNTNHLSQAGTPNQIQSALNSEKKSYETYLFPRITTLIGDAEILVDALPPYFKMAEKEVSYDMGIQTATEYNTIIYRPPGAMESPSYDLQQQILRQGVQYMHCADHVWDAQVKVTSTKAKDRLEPELDHAVTEFLKSMRTDGSPPSFIGAFDLGVFEPQEILAKRIVTYTGGGISFVVTEVQDLSLTERDNPSLNFRARVLSREDMLKEQRIWYEARFETNELARLSAMQGLAINFLSLIDNVGSENRGPSSFQAFRRPDQDVMRNKDRVVMEGHVYW